jgi:hypothetical protein
MNSATGAGLRSDERFAIIISRVDLAHESLFVHLTSWPAWADTAINAELKGIRNCGHGHVYVSDLRTCPCGS